MSSLTPEQPFSDPKAARLSRRRSWKTVLQELRARVKRTDEQIGDRLGVGKSQWRRILDHGEDDGLHLHDVEALPAEMARGVLERLAQLFGLEVRDAAPEETENTTRALARFGKLQAEVHDVLTLYFGTIQKGVLLGDAAARLVVEIDEAIRELQKLRAIAEKAATVRVLGVDARSDEARARDQRATR